MISKEALRNKLDGYPEPIIHHYEAFFDARDPARLNAFVIGLIRFLQDAEFQEDEPLPADSTDLRDGLGIDSITIAEVVFLLEEILEIEIENQDLMNIQTVGQLKSYILKKLGLS